MTEPAGRCVTCRWAEPDRSTVVDVAFPLYCTKMAAGDFASRRGQPLHADTLAYAPDTESYLGSLGLCVKPEFGCVMWEAKRAGADHSQEAAS